MSSSRDRRAALKDAAADRDPDSDDSGQAAAALAPALNRAAVAGAEYSKIRQGLYEDRG